VHSEPFDFLFIQVDSHKSRQIELMIRRVLMECRSWGLQCPTKVNVLSLRLWKGAADEYSGCILEGFAAGDEASFSEQVREDEVVHEVLHNTYPEKEEAEIRELTQRYALRLLAPYRPPIGHT